VAGDPLIPLITTVPMDAGPAEVHAYLARQHERLRAGAGFSFAIADEDTDEAVGQIGLWTSEIATGRATTGYWVAPRFRRRGCAVAALGALTAWALTLDEVHRLQLHVEPWNEGSWRAAEACGYRREGLLRSWQRVGDERRDMFVYSILTTDTTPPRSVTSAQVRGRRCGPPTRAEVRNSGSRCPPHRPARP